MKQLEAIETRSQESSYPIFYDELIVPLATRINVQEIFRECMDGFFNVRGSILNYSYYTTILSAVFINSYNSSSTGTCSPLAQFEAFNGFNI